MLFVYTSSWHHYFRICDKYLFSVAAQGTEIAAQGTEIEDLRKTNTELKRSNQDLRKSMAELQEASKENHDCHALLFGSNSVKRQFRFENTQRKAFFEKGTYSTTFVSL
jgi:predicted RNase H-like nuclease (RuvC/YqgF family)